MTDANQEADRHFNGQGAEAPSAVDLRPPSVSSAD
ncbi:hypothetical protein FHX15_006069 [Rhizobium sp. BK650]|nr:hypothetical protein [Rhizobium sp. BK650]